MRARERDAVARSMPRAEELYAYFVATILKQRPRPLRPLGLPSGRSYARSQRLSRWWISAFLSPRPVPVKRTRASRSPACQKQLQLRERDLAALMQSQIRRFPSAEPALGARARLATAAACSLTSTLRSGIKKSTRTIG